MDRRGLDKRGWELLCSIFSVGGEIRGDDVILCGKTIAQTARSSQHLLSDICLDRMVDEVVGDDMESNWWMKIGAVSHKTRFLFLPKKKDQGFPSRARSTFSLLSEP